MSSSSVCSRSRGIALVASLAAWNLAVSTAWSQDAASADERADGTVSGADPASPADEVDPATAPSDGAPSDDAAPTDAAEAPALPDAAVEEPPPEPAPSEPLDLSFDLPVVGRTTFSMTSTTTVRYRGNNDDRNPINPFNDDFFAISQRFDLALQSAEVRLEVRLDGFLPFAFDGSYAHFGVEERRPGWFGSQNVGAIDGYRIPTPEGESWGSVCPEELAALCGLAWDVRPERMALRWEHEGWTVEAGDSQLVVGRGIALSFRKVDLLAVDNALRGGHVRYDDGHLRGRLHFGLANPQNQDPLTLTIFQDPEDLVLAGGLGATFGPGDLISVNGHYVRVWFANPTTGGSLSDRAVDVLGWSFEMPALADGRLALYAEVDAMRRSWVVAGASMPGGPIDSNEQSFGRAIYASAQLALDELTVLVEWKDYRDFLVAAGLGEGNPWRIYNAAPSLEFDGPQRLRAIGNQRGGSVRMDYAFLPGPWSFSVNFASFGIGEECEPTRCIQDPFDGILATHGWASIARRQEYGDEWVWSFSLTGGYRRESYIHDGATHGAFDMDREMTHGILAATLGSGEHSIELSADHRYEQERDTFGTVRPFQVGGVSLTYTYGIQLTIAATLRWSDFLPGVVQSRAERYGLDPLSATMFPSLELQWNFDPGTFVRGFVGATPGGQICSGGVCREVPAFEGVVVQFVGRL